MLGDQSQEGQSLETCKRFQSCLGKVKGDLSCLGEVEEKKKMKRNFFCLVLVFSEHQSSRIKAIKRCTALPLSRVPYFYVSKDNNLPSLLGYEDYC